MICVRFTAIRSTDLDSAAALLLLPPPLLRPARS
jgi:hypothetical protein